MAAGRWVSLVGLRAVVLAISARLQPAPGDKSSQGAWATELGALLTPPPTPARLYLTTVMDNNGVQPPEADGSLLTVAVLHWGGFPRAERVLGVGGMCA